MQRLAQLTKQQRDQAFRQQNTDPQKNIIIGSDATGAGNVSNPTVDLAAHKISGDHDTRYYTITEVNGLFIAQKITDLADVPDSYIGMGGKVLAVKSTEDGIEFKDAGQATNGIPAGGTINQILAKNSAADYDSKWMDAPAAANGLPTGGTAGQILKKKSATDYDAEWGDAPSGGSNVLDRYGIETTVANSTAEITVYSGLTIDANSIGIGGALKITINFDESHSVVATTSIRFKLGTTTVFTMAYQQGSTDVVKPSRLELIITNLGSASSQRCFCNILYRDGSTKQLFGYGTSSVDTTVDQALSITAQHNVANTGVYYKQYCVTVEKAA